MKRAVQFARPEGFVLFPCGPGRSVRLPLFTGLLKHPAPGQLKRLLKRPEVSTKYTQAALQKAPWPILKWFPRSWLRRVLPTTEMDASRRRAIEFLLRP
jgi:hypothetical protein